MKKTALVFILVFSFLVPLGAVASTFDNTLLFEEIQTWLAPLFVPMLTEDPEEFASLPYAEKMRMFSRLLSRDPEQAQTFLKDSLQGTVKGIFEAHEFTHLVGEAMYHRYGIEGIKRCSPFSASGCQHGVSVAAMGERGSSAIPDIVEACMTLVDRTDTQFETKVLTCIHGLGHGIASMEGLDMARSLSACEEIEPGPAFNDDTLNIHADNNAACVKGAIMEIMAGAGVTSRFGRFSPRIEQSAEKRGFGTMTDLIAWCASAPSAAYRDLCLNENSVFHVVLADAPGGPDTINMTEAAHVLARQCRASLPDTAYFSHCIEMVTGFLVLLDAHRGNANTGSDILRSNIASVCGTLSEAPRLRCIERGTAMMNNYALVAF